MKTKKWSCEVVFFIQPASASLNRDEIPTLLTLGIKFQMEDYGNSVGRGLVTGESVSGELDGGCEGDFPPIKRPKLIIHDHDRDRLSDLPDLPLLNILSHLHFDQAARTSILSKRFGSLWNSVTALNFSDEASGKYGLRFVEFVNTSLGYHRGFDLEKFSVKFCYKFRYREAVDHWIKFACQNQVKSLHLNLAQKGRNHAYNLPVFLYNYENLVELVTSFCRFSKELEINWTSLRLLSITRARLKEEFISKILLGCPVLEILELRSWSGSDRLKISSTSLRVLRIVEEETGKSMINPEKDYFLEISGPNLVSLEVSGSLYRTRIRLSDLESLESANMNFEIRVGETSNSNEAAGYCHGDIARDVFQGLRHVKKLALGGWCIKVLAAFEKYNLSPTWSERKSLTVCIPATLWDHLGMANLLHSSPCLETLVVRLSSSSREFDFEHTYTFPSSDDEEYFWKSWRTSSRCPLLHLKFIKIFGVEVAEGAMKSLCRFLKFALRNSRQLEKVVIQTSGRMKRKTLEEALNLLSAPRASPDAVVQLEPLHLWVDSLCMYLIQNINFLLFLCCIYNLPYIVLINYYRHPM